MPLAATGERWWSHQGLSECVVLDTDLTVDSGGFDGTKQWSTKKNKNNRQHTRQQMSDPACDSAAM